MAAQPSFKLLTQFEKTFRGTAYKHRNSNLGNRIADCLYEDLVHLGMSAKYASRVQNRTRVLNPKGKSPGIRARRGDGSFGDIVPGTPPTVVPGFVVWRGPTANVEIGAEVKILAKAMIKQIDRVINDLKKQAEHFKHKSPDSIAVAVVGICCAASYTSYEGDRSYPTDGGSDRPHPIQEAPEAKRRIQTLVAPFYDELVVLEFDATNIPPYPFSWVNKAATKRDYSAMLVRLSREYDRRF